MARRILTKQMAMHVIRPIAIMAALGCAALADAQDAIRPQAMPDMPLQVSEATVFARPPVTLPDSAEVSAYSHFVGTAGNVIADHGHSLGPFVDKFIRLLSTGSGALRIVHVGDSHVRGHFFPGAVKDRLEALLGGDAVEHDGRVFDYNTPGISRETGRPGVVYQVYGINGATAQTFTDARQVATIGELSPDLLIVSLGTNESMGRSYSAVQHKNQLDQLVRMLAAECPGVPLLLTTPPGDYRKSRGRYEQNRNVARAAETIAAYAKDKGYACWDLYHIVGGETHACSNWQSAGLMQRDHIHFTKQGYALMGVLLYNAIIKLVKDYARY